MCDLATIRRLVDESESDTYACRDYALIAARLTEDAKAIPEGEAEALGRILADCQRHAERIVDAWVRLHNALCESDR